MNLWPFFPRPEPSILVDRVCEQATTIAVLAEVAQQQAAHIEALRRASKLNRRMKRKDSAAYIAEYITTTGRLKRLAGME